MKYINIPIYLNRVILGITGVLYFTIFFGLYAQIVLGAFQVVTGLILLLVINKLKEKSKKTLLIYWTMVVSYFFLWSIGVFDQLGDWWVFYYILIPLGIATYFTFFLESLKNRK